MPSLSEIAASTNLTSEDVAHLRRLIASWGMAADFCFADLLLVAPADADTFVVVGQVRPTTSQTLYQGDLVGHRMSVRDRPQLMDVWTSGEIVEGQNRSLDGERAARVEYIPVRRAGADGRVLAVVMRDAPLDTVRRPGRLERTYLEIFDRLAVMISSGEFPFPATDDDGGEDAPRVGDGVLAVDAHRTVTYASPNAVSAMHRMGMFANIEGRALADLGIEVPTVERRPLLVEAEREGDSGRVIVQLRFIPLLDRRTFVGAVILLRDVSDIRRRDRLLLSKDATIREVHHRVKNNLQTISSLLRLQGRRLAAPEAKQAFEESARRIRSIALVHETLSRDPSDTVPFDEIVRPLVRLVEEGLVEPGRHVRFVVEGDAGDLAPEVATPLAVVLTELLQNAVEHGFEDDPGMAIDDPGTVTVQLSQKGNDLSVVVRDNGVGIARGFSLSESAGLGLSIVRTLVTSELGGAIMFRRAADEGGTIVELRVPIRRP